MAAIPGTTRTERTGRTATRPRLEPRVTAGVNGATTGTRRAAAPSRPLPSGWGVARKRFSRTMIVALALLAIASAGIVQVLQTSRVAEVGYALRSLELERQQLSAQIRLLEARVAESSNLEHLHTQAVEELGMVPPEETLRIAVNAMAPAVVPLPRRYVETPPEVAPPQPSWWEELIGSIPGFN